MGAQTVPDQNECGGQWGQGPMGLALGNMGKSGYTLREVAMCRNIKTLFNFEPPATDEEIRASSLQFVRKLSGFNKPSKINEAAFDLAVEQVNEAARTLIQSLKAIAPPRDRESLREKAIAETAKRFRR